MLSHYAAPSGRRGLSRKREIGRRPAGLRESGGRAPGLARPPLGQLQLALCAGPRGHALELFPPDWSGFRRSRRAAQAPRGAAGRYPARPSAPAAERGDPASGRPQAVAVHPAVVDPRLLQAMRRAAPSLRQAHHAQAPRQQAALRLAVDRSISEWLQAVSPLALPRPSRGGLRRRG